MYKGKYNAAKNSKLFCVSLFMARTIMVSGFIFSNFLDVAK